MALKSNIIANFLGQGWSALMALAFIPIYIRYLGMDAYGLIGVFALLQAWLAVLDAGLTPTLSREMARYSAGGLSNEELHELALSVERIFIIVAVAIAVIAMVAAPWLSRAWLRPEELDTATVTQALVIAGWVIAFRWMAGLYKGAINGLQQQVWLNVCSSAFATARGLGAVGVLIWVSPTIQAFFVYQGIVTAVEAMVLAIQMRRFLPPVPRAVRFSMAPLRRVWRFAGGMTAITVLATLLAHVDKLMLSNLLTLSDFGYYMLASAVAAAVHALIGPIFTATYPRLVELVAQGSESTVAAAYHYFAQLLSVVVLPPAMVMAMLPEHLLVLWTGDASLAITVAPLLSLLVIGSMLNGVMHIPYALQLAHGWTQFAVRMNIISVALLVPAIYIGVSHYGAIAAAMAWMILNVGYVTVGMPFMHRRLLKSELHRWYLKDVGGPLVASFTVAGLARVLAPAPSVNARGESLLMMVIIVGAALLAALVTTELGRQTLQRTVRRC
ncbi:MAG: oligosaccharide flippase family protein [Gammaproteobacteria bacterium]